MITIPDMMVPMVRGLRTKDERDLLREQIGELEAAMFRSDRSASEKILRARLPEHIAVMMRDILARQEFKNNPQALKVFFQDFRTVLDALTLLNVSIAFRPSEEMIDRLHEWTQQNLGTDVILDIDYDGSMLGGARIVFNGRYKEMTLAQMITNALIKEKTTIMGMIK